MSSSPDITSSPSSSDIRIDPTLSKRPSREVPKYSQATMKNPQQMVTLYAGDDPEKFLVHKDFACHYSPVLRAAFNSEFLEGQTQEYRFQNTTKDAVFQLVNWVYTQKLIITCIPDEPFEKKDVVKRLKSGEDKTLIELYALADSLLIPKLQNFVIKEMQRIKKQTNMAISHVFDLAYEKTQEGSPLRRYLAADCATSQWVGNGYFDSFPKQMLMDMLICIRDANLPNTITSKIKADSHMEDFEAPED